VIALPSSHSSHILSVKVVVSNNKEKKKPALIKAGFLVLKSVGARAAALS
jgi:hypothetical protein